MSSHESDDRKGGRNSGRTSEQIKRAPSRALMVTLNSRHNEYSRSLARSLGRSDIKFVSLETAKLYGWQLTRGLRGRDAVMLDHACWSFMTRAERDEFYELQAAYEW